MIKPICVYSKCHYVFNKLNKSTTFDRTLLSCWNLAEKDGAMNYKIDECNMISKFIKIGNVEFVVTLNEKRFTVRRKPQTMTLINQKFDSEKFNFTKVKEKEILMYTTMKLEDQEYEYSKAPNVIMVNASPFQRGHSLLIPEMTALHNQWMRPRPLRTALEICLISGENNFGVAFNSMLACASVNHLHFHLWINETPFACSKIKSQPLQHNGSNITGLYHLPDHPIDNIVVEMDSAEDIDEHFQYIWSAISVLQRLQLPHSIIFVRPTATAGGGVGGVRCVIWPRKPATSSTKSLERGIINIAVSELAGQIFTGDSHLFHSSELADKLRDSIYDIKLDRDVWTGVLSQLMKN